MTNPRQAANAFADRVLKVDHAGEHGAVNIYAGQMLVARLTARDLVPQLAEFQSHERRHRAIFQAELARRGVRRCRSYHVCGIGGFVLGFITALFGRGAIAATTVAVERVVLRHLQGQISALRGSDDADLRTLSEIVSEEQQHHDLSARHVPRSRFWLRLRRTCWPQRRRSTALRMWRGAVHVQWGSLPEDPALRSRMTPRAMDTGRAGAVLGVLTRTRRSPWSATSAATAR